MTTRVKTASALALCLFLLSALLPSVASIPFMNEDESLHWVAVCGRLNNSSVEFTFRMSLLESTMWDRREELRQEGYHTALPGDTIDYKGQQGIVQYNCEVKTLYDPTVTVTMIFTCLVMLFFYVCLPTDHSGHSMDRFLQPAPERRGARARGWFQW